MVELEAGPDIYEDGAQDVTLARYCSLDEDWWNPGATILAWRLKKN
jgi:hypothetical protein